MQFEWDRQKRKTNIRKHGFDFLDAAMVFEGDTLTIPDEREEYGEERFVTLGLLKGVVVVIVHAEEEDLIRIISMRKATKNEEINYFKEIGHELETGTGDDRQRD
jgi:uncharacterized DUF497 family protein